MSITNASAPPTAHPHYTSNPSLFPLEGGCACGQTRYRLEKAPLVVHCCHCTVCQREAGTAFCINALIESDQVTRLPPAKPTTPLNISDAGSNAQPKPAGPPLVPAPKGEESGPPLTKVKMPTQSGFGQTIVRCSVCATAVWSHYAGAGEVISFIRVGTLDRAWEVAPDLHIYTRSMRDFVRITDGMPQFQEYYPGKEGVWRPESIKRFMAKREEIGKFLAEKKRIGAKF